jgi:hypothetical protein
VALRLRFVTAANPFFARPTDDETRRDAPWSGVKLTVERREDVVEILATLPKMSGSVMIATRSLARIRTNWIAHLGGAAPATPILCRHSQDRWRRS